MATGPYLRVSRIAAGAADRVGLTMFPVLIKVGTITLDTYYVFWMLALSLAMLWSIRRFRLYGVDDGEARRVIGWAFFAMLLGARAFEYLWNFDAYYEDPSLLLDLRHGGLSEVGAFTGAFLAAFLLCWRNPKLPFQRLCDVVAPPAIFTMALGRWGCFFNGCCIGIPTLHRFGVHFPHDPASVMRHPTQIYYSIASLAILVILLTVEHFILRHRSRENREKMLGSASVITPLGLILYSIMRLSIDGLRAEGLLEGLGFSHWVLLAALPLEVLWLDVSLWSNRTAVSTSTPAKDKA